MTPLAAVQDGLLAMVLCDLAVVAACALAFGALARRVRQAPVVGEILAGVLLGPSMLGLLPGHLDTLLFPEPVRPYLQLMANVALVLFMFGVGFEVDVERMRCSARAVTRVACGSVLVPVAAAVAVAPLLWASHPSPEHRVSEAQFVTFIAIVLSVTAFPVLARLVQEAGLSRTPLATIALSVAAITDLLAWTALAALTATLGLSTGGVQLKILLPVAAGFAVMLVSIRPLLQGAFARGWADSHGAVAGSMLLLVALAVCASAATRVGLHPALGAFALGVACAPLRVEGQAGAIGRARGVEAEAAARVTAAAQTLSSAGLLLVPLYFVVTGLNVDVASLGPGGLLEAGGFFVVATASKLGGVTWSSARAGIDGGRAVGLALLLNTRGLTELIVLNIGRTAGVIDDRLFTALVLAAVFTTALTMPLLPFAIGTRARRVARVARGAPRVRRGA